MEQFTVPQFIDAEDKILGPLTARQFIEALVTFLIVAALYKLVPSLIWFLVIGIPIFIAGMILAFVPINGQPFHFFLLNVVQTLRRPQLRVWDKQRTDAEVRAAISETAPPPPVLEVPKGPLVRSRLEELSLVIDTGGVYKPDEY